MNGGPTLLSEIARLLQGLLLWIMVWLVLSAVIFSVGLQKVVWAEHTWRVPIITTHSFASDVLVRMTHDLVPPGVHLIVTDPFAAFTLETEVSILLAFCILLPVGLIGLLRYMSPALYRTERIVLYSLVVPGLLLFAAGVVFAYVLVIPPMLFFLFDFVPATGAEPLYSLTDFFPNILSILVVTGLMFELPIGMIVLSYLGIIRSSFWRTHWRYAVLTFLILTAIITPDASGVSMIILTTPLMLLYGVGLSISSRVEKKRLR